MRQAGAQIARLADGADEVASGVLAFQIALLDDPELIAPALAGIDAGEPADSAWRRALDLQIHEYESGEDEYFRARAADLADLRDRVDRLLAGEAADAPTPMVAGAIYVAEDLTPTRFLEIDWSGHGGAALFGGSAASHVAMLARARGVPLLIGLEAERTALVDGAPALLDAEQGRLILDPSEATRRRYSQRIAERAARASEAAAHLARPAAMADGTPLKVYLNVDDPRLLAGVDVTHCDGIGLTRTEFLFHGGGELPDEERQFAVYAALLDWAAGRPVTIRTLDAGGDKPIPGLTPEGESNPFLGVRGLRLSLARPDVFAVQLRALARAAVRGKLRVMVPMVTAPWEMAQARAFFEQQVAALQQAGQAARMPSFGMMVEVPAAALNVAAFQADFLSIGTNDLIQYTLAAGRDCAGVASLQDPADPAVLELIARVAAHGRLAGIEVSVCGEMAARPESVGDLLDAGIRALSVPPAALAATKAAVARHGRAGRSDTGTDG
jgi:phosphotransferase system enzyme I (PtsI)